MRRHPTRPPFTVAEIARLYVFLLPLAAVATFYLLVVDRATATRPSDLANAGYGLPFDWVEQDLSRFDPAGYPVSIEFNWTRAWHDPIETHIDWLMLIADTLIVGIGVTGCAVALMAVLRRTRRRRETGEPEDPRQSDRYRQSDQCSDDAASPASGVPDSR